MRNYLERLPELAKELIRAEAAKRRGLTITELGRKIEIHVPRGLWVRATVDWFGLEIGKKYRVTDVAWIRGSVCYCLKGPLGDEGYIAACYFDKPPKGGWVWGKS